MGDGTGHFIEASGGGVEIGVFHFFDDVIELEMAGVISYSASHRNGE